MLPDLYVKETKLREYLSLASDTALLSPDARIPDVTSSIAEHLASYNIEWHVIPSAEAAPFDEAYVAQLYPMRTRDFAQSDYSGHSLYERLAIGHRIRQGRISGVETTRKPRYHLDNRQYYGTMYGFDQTTDPLGTYLKQAGTPVRYAHDFLSLRKLVDLVNQEWQARSLLPHGFRLTICSPAVFNLVGTVFHPEWSETESLELGFYRDEMGNATCYAVGSNEPGDYSYIQRVESESDWMYLGFRLVLVPD